MKENPHNRVNLETYMYKCLSEEQIKYLIENNIQFKPNEDEIENNKKSVKEEEYEEVDYKHDEELIHEVFPNIYIGDVEIASDLELLKR